MYGMGAEILGCRRGVLVYLLFEQFCAVEFLLCPHKLIKADCDGLSVEVAVVVYYIRFGKR